MKVIRHPLFLVLAFLVCTAAAAAAFVYAALEIKDAAQRSVTTTRTTTDFHRVKLTFEPFIGRTLQPRDLRPLVRDIVDPHVLTVHRGVLYVASWRNRSLYAIDLQRGERRLLADDIGEVGGLVAEGDDSFLATVTDEGKLERIDLRTGRAEEVLTGLAGPFGITATRDKDWYVSNRDGGTIIKVKRKDASVKDVAGGLAQPKGLLADNDNIITVTLSGDPARGLLNIADNGKQSVATPGILGAEAILRDDLRNGLITGQVKGEGVLYFWQRGHPARILLHSGLSRLGGLATDGVYLYTADPAGNTVYRLRIR